MGNYYFMYVCKVIYYIANNFPITVYVAWVCVLHVLLNNEIEVLFGVSFFI